MMIQKGQKALKSLIPLSWQDKANDKHVAVIPTKFQTATKLLFSTHGQIFYFL